MESIELKRIGVDDWSRPVYKDNNGELWKDVNCDGLYLSLYSVCNNIFSNFVKK